MSELIQVGNMAGPVAGWSVRRRERIPMPPERVWPALLTPADLCRWWCDEAEVDPQVGGRYRFGGPHVFGHHDGMEAIADGEILELVPNERLAFSWRIGAVATRVTYELQNVLELTELTVTQTADHSPAGELGVGSPNWWWIALPALRSCLESGAPDLRVAFATAGDAAIVEFTVNVTTFPWIVWSKLIEVSQLDRWIASRAEIDPQPGGVFTLGPGPARPGPTHILEIEPERRLVHDWSWAGDDEPASTVEWTIEETDTATRVTVKDHGPWPPGTRRDLLAIHWASHLLNLKQMSARGVTPREYQA